MQWIHLDPHTEKCDKLGVSTQRLSLSAFHSPPLPAAPLWHSCWCTAQMALHCFRPTRFVKVAVELFRNCDSYSCKSSTDNDQRRWHWRDEPPQSCSVQTLWYKLLLESVKDCKQKHILFVALRSINVRLHIHPLLHVRGMKYLRNY